MNNTLLIMAGDYRQFKDWCERHSGYFVGVKKVYVTDYTKLYGYPKTTMTAIVGTFWARQDASVIYGEVVARYGEPQVECGKCGELRDQASWCVSCAARSQGASTPTFQQWALKYLQYPSWYEGPVEVNYCPGCMSAFSTEHSPCDESWCGCKCREGIPRLPDRWEPYRAFRRWDAVLLIPPRDQVLLPSSFPAWRLPELATKAELWPMGVISRVGGDNQHLQWKIGEPTQAVCAYPLEEDTHIVPSEWGECGLYGYWHASPEPDTVIATLAESVSPSTGMHELSAHIDGVAEFWGLVQKHEKGLRAEWAEPIAFTKPRVLYKSPDPKVKAALVFMERLAEFCRADLVDWRDIREVMKYGPDWRTRGRGAGRTS